MENERARARRRRGRLCPRPQVLTRGSDDLEVGRAGAWHEALANRVDQPSLAAHQSRDGHALDECPALDTGFEGIADAFVDAAEECLIEPPSIRGSITVVAGNAFIRLTASAASAVAPAPFPSRPPTFRSSRWMREYVALRTPHCWVSSGSTRSTSERVAR